MKISWKEILVIFVLAVLATGLSLVILRTVPCPKTECPPGEICPETLCTPIFERGWLLPFYNEWGNIFGFIPMFVDILFYFVIFLIGWVLIKIICRRLKR